MKCAAFDMTDEDEKLVEDLENALANPMTLMFNLGNCFQYGIGVEQNLTTAVEWYTNAAKMVRSAVLFVKIKSNVRKVFTFFREACRPDADRHDGMASA